MYLYKDFVISKDTQYRPFLVGSDIKAKLERIQNDHFQYRINKMDKPPDMIELLEEYLKNEDILPKNIFLNCTMPELTNNRDGS